MANRKKSVKENVPGDIFVDTTCINCDACRRFAPQNFKNIGEFSAVSKQPDNHKEELEVARALLSCPTGSIGGSGSEYLKKAKESFPLKISENVYINGFNSSSVYREFA